MGCLVDGLPFHRSWGRRSNRRAVLQNPALDLVRPGPFPAWLYPFPVSGLSGLLQLFLTFYFSTFICFILAFSATINGYFNDIWSHKYSQNDVSNLVHEMM
jgi:hypothetical protein